MGFPENQKLAKDINSNTEKNTQSMEELLTSLGTKLETTKNLVNTMASKFVSKAYVDSGDAALDTRVNELRDTLWKNDEKTIAPLQLGTYKSYKTVDTRYRYAIGTFNVEDMDKFNYVFATEPWIEQQKYGMVALFDLERNKFDFAIEGNYYDMSAAFDTQIMFRGSNSIGYGLELVNGVLTCFAECQESSMKYINWLNCEQCQFKFI